jgi:hypothetical protein
MYLVQLHPSGGWWTTGSSSTRSAHVPRRPLLTLAAVLLAATACTSQGDTPVRWDLSDTRSIDAVGWPDDVDGPAWSRDDVTEVVLPGGAVVEGPLRARMTRPEPGADRLDSLVLEHPDEPVEEVAARGGALAETLGFEPAWAQTWAVSHRDGRDPSSVATAFVDGTIAGVLVTLEARAVEDGLGYLTIVLTW